MTKEEYAKYLTSVEWANLRDLKFASCPKVCNRCGYHKNLQVHHINYRNIRDLKLEDLEILCRRCHQKEHGFKYDSQVGNPKHRGKDGKFRKHPKKKFTPLYRVHSYKPHWKSHVESDPTRSKLVEIALGLVK